MLLILRYDFHFHVSNSIAQYSLRRKIHSENIVILLVLHGWEAEIDHPHMKCEGAIEHPGVAAFDHVLGINK